MHDYKKLDVWRKAHALALEMHRVAPPGPDRAAADFAADLRHAAAEIPVLIIRGCDAETEAEFVRAIGDAAVAAEELAYRLLFARDAGVLSDVVCARLEARANQLRAMLGGLIRTVCRTSDDRRQRSARAAVSETPAGRPMPAGRSVARTQMAVARAMRSVRGAGSSQRQSPP